MTKSFDDFKKITSFKGQQLDSGDSTVFLRSWKLADGKLSHQVYVADTYYGGWRFYQSATDSDGKDLEFTSINRSVGTCGRYTGCSHNEHVGISVSKAYLESKKTTGMRFRVYGKGGQETFTLPGDYIADYLNEVK